MIKNKATAQSALDLMNNAHGLLTVSLRLAEETCSDEEYRIFQSEMAQVLGQLFFSVMEPIYREHPSLAPPDTPKEFLEAWRKNSNGETQT